MLIWDDQNMPGIDGPDIHKCAADIVRVDKTGGRIPPHDVAEYAVRHFFRISRHNQSRSEADAPNWPIVASNFGASSTPLIVNTTTPSVAT